MKPDRSKAELQNNGKEPGDSQNNLLHLFNCISDSLIVHDMNGLIFKMNQSAMKLCKVSENEIDRFNIFDYFNAGADFSAVSNFWPDILLGHSHDCEWSFIDWDTNERKSIQISMNRTNWDGKPAILAVISDFDLQKKIDKNLISAREKADENEYKFRTLFEQASDGVLICDKNGNYLEVNESSCNMLGYSKNELLKLNIKDVFLKENSESFPINISEMESGNVVIAEGMLIRKDGSVFPVEISGSMPQDRRMQVIFRDVTERKRLEKELVEAKEKAEENDRLKTAFMHNISHEIRTPLNAIMGFADLLPEYFYDKENLKRYSEIISQRGTDLMEFIDDILHVAKIESGQLSINQEEFNLGTFFSELNSFYGAYKLKQNKKDVKFNIRVAPELKDLNVEADHKKLKQILLSLVGNAFKFTAIGWVEIGCQLSEPGALTFYVSDTGIGIAREMHSVIFNRFMQVNKNTSQVYGGCGLGLTIALGLLQILDGKIWLDSEIGKGSTFYFTIPFKPVFRQIDLQAEQLSEIKDENINMSILIVEDDYYNSEYLKEVLADTGFSIKHASSGRKAIEICSSQSVDLVLMDVRLPDMTGFEAIFQIRKIKPKQNIIAQTAYVLNDEKEKALEAGCINYISKPIKRDQLLSMILDVNHKVVNEY